MRKDLQKLFKPVDRNLFWVLHQAILRDYDEGKRNRENAIKELEAVEKIRKLLEV
jgi:hypothetical protein